MYNDLRYGFRMLLKSPGFTTVAVLSLALGIGANTAIFSLIDAVMLKSLPVKNPEQLYQISHVGTGGISEGSNYPLFEQFRDRNQVFSEIFAANLNQWKVSVHGETELLVGQVVTGNYYSVLGVNTILGRPITIEDDRVRKGHPVAVISYSYWNRRFGLDPTVLGKTIHINLTPFTIIGVTPLDFFGLQPGYVADVTVPMAMHPLVGSGSSLDDPQGWWSLEIIGRLKPGISLQQARADLDVIFQQFMSAPWMSWLKSGREYLWQRIELTPAGNGLPLLRRQFSLPLRILMIIVGLVLLIACANVANLLLVCLGLYGVMSYTVVRRTNEIGIRMALGAQPSKVLWMVLRETLGMIVIGLALGLPAALVATRLASNLLFGITPTDPVTICLVTFMILAVGLFAGYLPARRASRVDPMVALTYE